MNLTQDEIALVIDYRKLFHPDTRARVSYFMAKMGEDADAERAEQRERQRRRLRLVVNDSGAL